MLAAKLIVFDLDGTLVHTLPDIATSLNWALMRLQLGNLAQEKIRGFIGDGVEKLVERTLGEFSEKDPLKVAYCTKLFRQHHGQHCLDQVACFPGVVETLEHFSSTPMAVLTNKPHVYATRILDHLGLAAHFHSVIGGDCLAVRKPDPMPLEHIMGLTGIQGRQTVMIGDSEQDIQCGKACGAMTVGVTYGYQDASRLQVAECRIDSILELQTILTGM